MTVIGFTGTRRGMTGAQLAALDVIIEAASRGLEFHHGGCRGADLEAAALTRGRAIIHAHPGPGSLTAGADVAHPVRPYLERNRDIVDACDVLIACPSGREVVWSGTWYTVRYARRVGRPRIVLMP